MDCLPAYRFTFDVPKTKCVVHDGDRQDVRLLLLKEGLDPAGVCVLMWVCKQAACG